MSDQIQRFMFDHTNVRGEIVTLATAYHEVLDRHAYPPAVNELLGELLAAVALLTDTVKLDGTLSIEVRGQGMLSLLMAESNPGGELRAIARIAEDAVLPSEHANFRELVGEGQIVITLDPREGNRYQGIVALDQASHVSGLRLTVSVQVDCCFSGYRKSHKTRTLTPGIAVYNWPIRLKQKSCWVLNSVKCCTVSTTKRPCACLNPKRCALVVPAPGNA